MTPGNRGRFDGYDVMAQRKHWDPTTAEVVASRLQVAGELHFFTESEAQTAGALLDAILAQHEEPKVPVLMMVDARLDKGETDGWRYEDMPEDLVAWRETLIYLDADANEAFGPRFHECSVDEQRSIVQGVQDAKSWHGMPAAHVWSLWARYACAAYYSHPWAWNEVGFGGPAYPRGYKVLRPGWHEPWEVAERDATDPVPWADRVEQAKRAHAVHIRQTTPKEG
ncbi:MAG: gluconate 2-dehydrogenase subunit 3 family protein [Acidimicrobiales bacterium]